jgi:uncharacterized Zn-binding protein involved in type VI secretion
MGQRPFIVVGDRTDHGGTVVQGSSITDTHGKAIARVGDQVTCPIRGHGTTVITTGDQTMIIDGKPAARHLDKCACGATLLAGQAVSTTSSGGASNPQAASNAQKATAASAGVFAQYTSAIEEETLEQDDLEYYFVAERDDGQIVNLAYRIDADGAMLHEGRIGPRG